MSKVNVDSTKRKQQKTDIDDKLKALREGISNDVTGILTPAIDKFYEITDGLDVRLSRVETGLIVVGIIAALAIVLVVIL